MPQSAEILFAAHGRRHHRHRSHHSVPEEGKLFRLTTSNTSRSVIDVGIRFGFLPPRLSTAALTIASLLFTFSGTIGSISGKLLETKNSLTHVSLIRPSGKRNIATVTKREHLICVLRTNCLFSVFVAASVFFLVYLKSMLVLGHGNPISMLSRIFPGRHETFSCSSSRWQARSNWWKRPLRKSTRCI